MVFTILYLNNKIVSHANMIRVKIAQTTHPANPVLVIIIKTTLVFCLTALAQLASILIPLINKIAYVYLSLIFTIKTY
jgi:hypothetical protein